MKEKIETLSRDIVKTFPEAAPIKTQKFVLFLMFGANDDIIQIFRDKTAEILADPKSCAFIKLEFNECNNVSHWRHDIDFPALYKTGLDCLTETIAYARRDGDPYRYLTDMNMTYVCPIIFTNCNNYGDYSNALKLVENQFVTCVVKPFLLLGEMIGRESLVNKWLEVVEKGIHDFPNCRCCVLTNRNEKGFEVYLETNVNTILFMAFMQACSEIEAHIGRSSVVLSPSEAHSGKIEKLFYSAQTVSIANPIKLRVFRRLQKLIEELIAPSSSIDKNIKMDTSFLEQTLKTAYKKLPMFGGKVTFDPIYAVASNIENDLLQIELEKFANVYYKLNVENMREDNLFFDLSSVFMEEFLKLDVSFSKINELMIPSVLRSSGQYIDIAAITSITDSRFTNKEIYLKVAQKLKDNLYALRENLLDNFFKSKEFQSLPRKLTEIETALRRYINALETEGQKIERADSSLDFQRRIDDDWLNNNLKNIIFDIRSKLIVKIAQCEINEEKDKLFSYLIDELLKHTGHITIGGPEENRCFMEQVVEQGSDLLMDEISKKLRFPLRLNINMLFNSGTYCVCSNTKNPVLYLLQSEKEQLQESFAILPYDSEQRIDLLRISPGLSLQDIYIQKNTAEYLTSSRKTIEINEPEVFQPSIAEEHDSLGSFKDDDYFPDEFLEVIEPPPPEGLEYSSLMQVLGSYENGKIIFRWNPTADMKSRIHIIPITRKDDGVYFDTINSRIEKVRGGVKTIQIDYKIGGSGVSYADFAILTSNAINPKELIDRYSEILSNEPYIVRVLTGKSDVSWDILLTKLKENRDKGLRRCMIKLDSTAPIGAGILGYRFSYGGKNFLIPFPDAISMGTNVFGPLYMFGEAMPTVCSMTNESTNIILRRSKKKSIWPLFDRLRGNR